MIITNYNLHSQQELFDIIHKTYLAGDHNILPFKDAKLSIQQISYRDVLPTQTFVLNDQLNNIHSIYTQLMRQGIDIFNLHGFLSYQITNVENFDSNINAASNPVFIFTPPIIEIIDNQPLLIDGQHQIRYAGDNNKPFNALLIENIAKEVYPYQLPIFGGWDAVQRFDTKLPDGFVRKQRRYPTPEMNKFFFREYPFPGHIKIMRAHSGKPEGKSR